MKYPESNSYLQPNIKFNSGIGAILCLECRRIIKDNLSKEEIEGKTDIKFCDEKCEEKYYNKLYPSYD